jgi:hypothetical protein
MSSERFVCEKLRKMGYAPERHIRLYGEEFYLVSNPVADGEGFAVEGIARRSGARRRIRVPLSLVVTIRLEHKVLESKVLEHSVHEQELVAA